MITWSLWEAGWNYFRNEAVLKKQKVEEIHNIAYNNLKYRQEESSRSNASDASPAGVAGGVDMDRQKLDLAKKIIESSNYLVCLKGVQVSQECGCINYREEEDAYSIEEEYGYSPEEMINTSFYNTRPRQFYDFYRKSIIGNLGELKDGFGVLKKLEDRGILKYIITRDIFSLAKRAGCRNVIELHGSVYRNFCPHCKKEYDLDYVKNASGVPLCKNCGTAIRPGISLIGEMVDNQTMTRASEEVSKADTLLIVGCNLHSALAKMFVPYFTGDKIILIQEKEHFADNKADLVIHGKVMDILAQLGI